MDKISKKCSNKDCQNLNKDSNGELLLEFFSSDIRKKDKKTTKCKYCTNLQTRLRYTADIEFKNKKNNQTVINYVDGVPIVE